MSANRSAAFFSTKLQVMNDGVQLAFIQVHAVITCLYTVKLVIVRSGIKCHVMFLVCDVMSR